MIRTIATQRFLLKRPSAPATADDLEIACDLAETLDANRTRCIGMAANMIGQSKRIIAVIDTDGSVLTMLNPRITRRNGAFQAHEACLSLPGVRTALRYRTITVDWQDTDLKPHTATFKGPVAQAIQHEIDHLEGVLI
jgi:peptide deformylase